MIFRSGEDLIEQAISEHLWDYSTSAFFHFLDCSLLDVLQRCLKYCRLSQTQPLQIATSSIIDLGPAPTFHNDLFLELRS